MSGKAINVRFTIRSVLVQCLHHLLIQADDHGGLVQEVLAVINRKINP